MRTANRRGKPRLRLAKQIPIKGETSVLFRYIFLQAGHRKYLTDDENRGEGHGTELVSEFIDLCSSPIVLIADTGETLWIEKFYEDFGFETLFMRHGFPVMVLE